MIKKALLVLFVLSFAVMGCSKDAEILEFGKKLDTFTAELESKVSSSSDPVAGVDAAIKHLNDNKGPLVAQYKELENVRGFQVSEETMAAFTKTITENTMKIAGLKIKFIGSSNADLEKKIDELVSGYESIFE